MSIIDRPLRALKLLDQTPAGREALIHRDHPSSRSKHDRAGNRLHAERSGDLWSLRGIHANDAHFRCAQALLDHPDCWGLGRMARGARWG